MPSIKQIYNRFKGEYNKAVYGNCAVLLYHRVTELKNDPQLLSVTQQNFNAQMNLLKEQYKVLEVDEFKDCLIKRKRFPDKSILITFDDGYADNYYEALPVLEKYILQGMFYVATGTLNTNKEFWWDEVERIILLSNQFPSNWSLIVNNKVFRSELFQEGNKQEFYESILPELRKMDSISRDEKIMELAQLFNNNNPRASHRAMNDEELVKFNKSSSVVIGAHSHGHPSLGNLPYEQQRKEVVTSKNILEEKLDQKITHFSFPFGTIQDYNENTLKICKEAGFETIAANYPELVSRKSNKYHFPRFLIRNWKEDEFDSHLKTFFS